ncbi:hypothetical protein [Branchiibius sp. NY16-3462-2]|uniref:hypothetical protein n=1 Tax=Branchiibius sp. NY16-3462-2 TaxID=1807500 RepID=UPI000796C399|nr:hypothetical protein [Branchiibius sp. NY16-3462-2]KYH44435.1 hypothetical protein AZH51_07890 [Branchiibius sp. NY16-3462-2]
MSDDTPDTYVAPVDQQDGGPGSHSEDDFRGADNDVASGGSDEGASESADADANQDDDSDGDV